ncbi:WD40-repeat-containing domain protein [Lentinula detonsa]|uniref:WD40-repeat-containing domain protein n=1 Tax=Lentinula detonsa TaxID=2804962 RepID=A0A9W8TVK3_9AGAR|nr:WD40-repeat-containing domain protein [Lentinula detonsa]
MGRSERALKLNQDGAIFGEPCIYSSPFLFGRPLTFISRSMSISHIMPSLPKHSTSTLCDTLPAPRLSKDTDNTMSSYADDKSKTPPLPKLLSDSLRPSIIKEPLRLSSTSLQQPPGRKLCVRHQRMADEGTNLKLQHSLDALSLEERESVNAIWSSFSSSSHPRRALILQGLLTMCCFSQLSLLTEQLAHLIRIDPFAVLPREISLKVLRYLDATSLCRAAQVTKKWKSLADDDILWRGICEQHIGQKCHKCGWGLPVLEKKKIYHLPGHSVSPCPSPDLSSLKRALEDSTDLIAPPLKRQRSDVQHSSCSSDADPESLCSSSSSLLTFNDAKPAATTRPWKDVYSERMTIERNWRRGRCTVRTLKGHTDGVMCLQYTETLTHPSFPVLITGSYDRTVRVWNLETGVELHCLKGHTRAIRALQFDDVKLITGSMDMTLKVWDWRRGRCIRTLAGHTEGVVCLNFDSNVLASGSVDATIKVWNLRTGGAFTLRGHQDWVNSVQLWDSLKTGQSSASSTTPVFDVPGCGAPQIDPGKMLFSASDDGTIRLWDLTLRTCIKQFTGHVGQVQSIKLLLADECDEPADVEMTDLDQEERTLNHVVALDSSSSSKPSLASTSSSGLVSDRSLTARPAASSVWKTKRPLLVSGSLDNTTKIWDIETGQPIQTFFGHIEGVWSVSVNKMRLVSGSHDRTIKVWNREEGRCVSTLVGHTAAVSCVSLGEDKIVSGSDDCDVKVWSFSG